MCDLCNEECYAPILIPTLNRYEHLKRCIDSLLANPLASKTDIYISVDFPPDEKYQKGYERVKKYLTEELKSGFNNIFVYYQTHNLGADENCFFLWEKVFKNHNTFILTEDDNEFSPNFLKYMNDCLVEYENDESIFAICGYLGEHPWKYNEENIIFLPTNSPYGFASWKSKYDKFHEWLSWKNLIGLLRNKEKCDYIFNTRYKVYYTMVEALLTNRKKNSVYINKSGEPASIDYMVNIYLLTFKMKCVFPTISKSRNHGMDGSGLNSPRIEEYDPYKIQIDSENDFSLITPATSIINVDNMSLFREEEYKHLAIEAKKWRRIILWFGCDVTRILRIVCYEVSRLIKRITG